MPVTAANVLVGVTGSVLTAPTGTALPTTTGGALNAAFVDVGYISEDGISTTTNTDTNDIIAWQQGDVARRVMTTHDYQVGFMMIETNEQALKVYYNDFTHGLGATSGIVQVKGVQGYRGVWVLNVVDGTNLIRIVLPDAQVTEREDVAYTSGDAIGYGITLTCYADTSGVKAYIYYDTGGAS